MKKYKLNISVRNGMEDFPVDSFEVDTTHFTELFNIRKLKVFKEDAYLVVSLEELPEPEAISPLD